MTKVSEQTLDTSNGTSPSKGDNIIDEKLQRTVVEDIDVPSMETNRECDGAKEILETPSEEPLMILSNEASKMCKDLPSNESSGDEKHQQDDTDEQSSAQQAKETCSSTEAVEMANSPREDSSTEVEKAVQGSEEISVSKTETAENSIDINLIESVKKVENSKVNSDPVHIEDSKDTKLIEPIQTLQNSKDDSEPIQLAGSSKDIKHIEPVLIAENLKENNEPVENSKDISSSESVELTEKSKDNSLTEPIQIVENSKDNSESIQIADSSKDISPIKPVQSPDKSKNTNFTEPVETAEGLKDINVAHPVKPDQTVEDSKGIEPSQTAESLIDISEAVQTTESSRDISEMAQTAETSKKNGSSESTQSDPNKTAVDSEPASMYLQIYDDKFEMSCETKTENLNMLDVENISKDLCPTEFIVEMGCPPDAAEPPLPRNALLSAGTHGDEPQTSGKGEPDGFVGMVRQPRRSKSVYKKTTHDETDAKSDDEQDTADESELLANGAGTSAQGKKRSSLPNLKAAIARRQIKALKSQKKLVGSARTTAVTGDVDDATLPPGANDAVDNSDQVAESAGTAVKGKKRSSLPNLKAAIARKKMKTAGSRKKLVGGTRTPVPAKRAKSLGNAAKSPSAKTTPKEKKVKLNSTPWDSELLQVPLVSHGWFRELVLRKSSTPQRREGDIYYFTPEPERKKYRSRLEIQRMLPKDSPLKPEHFSFAHKLIGLGPEYERERNAANPGIGSPATMAPGKVKVKKTPAKSKTPAKATTTSPKKVSPKKTPTTPRSKRVPKKTAKLLAQEETDKENEAIPIPTEDTSPQVNKPRVGKTPKTPTNTVKTAEKANSKKKIIETENLPDKKSLKQKNKGKLEFEEKKATPKRRKSAKAKDSDTEITPELLNDDLSGANDKFPRLKLKISNGQIDRTPTGVKAEKPQKRASIVLKEKNSSLTSSSDRAKRKSNGPETSERNSSAKKDAKNKKEMGPASKTDRTPNNTPEIEKKKFGSEKKKNENEKRKSESDKKTKSTEKTKSSSKDKSSPNASSSSDELFGRKVPPISLTITKSPQKTIVSIKKSTDGKRPEIQVEIRKPAVNSSKSDDARSAETKKSEAKKSEVSSDTSDDGSAGDKAKPFFESMKTRKRGGFTLSKEECEIISGAKRSKTSNSPVQPVSPPGVSTEEANRLSSVKVLLSPCRESGKKNKDVVPSSEAAKKRRAVKTLEDEFDRIDKELLTAPPKRKRMERRESNPNEKNTAGDEKVVSPAGRQNKRASADPAKEKNEVKEKGGGKRQSKDKKENVMVNSEVKQNQVVKRKSSTLSITPEVLPPLSESSASHIGALFSVPATDRKSMHWFVVHLLSYLTVQERLRAAQVNKLFHKAAQHQSLWTHVRLKNTRVQDWKGLALAFSRHNTVSLDMKKMLIPADPKRQQVLWPDMPAHLSQIKSLRSLDLGKCSSDVFENLKQHLVQLESLSATLHKGQPVHLSHFNSMINLTKLKLKGYEIKKGAQNIFGPHNLSHLTNLTHLALTSVGNLNQASLDGITAACPQLRGLELGSCAMLNTPGAASHLSRLTSLEKLRLEIVVKEASVSILETVASMPALTHLELINVDVPSGFDNALALCTRIRTLIIIPTYVSQSALTNYLLLSGIGRLQNTLRLVSWGLTMELLQVTNMFAAKWRGATEFKSDGTCVPVMSPIPAFYLEDQETAKGKNPEVDLFPISKLKKLLAGHMRSSGVSIFTVSYSNTLRHTMMK